jgi:hypothetical protein
MISVTKHLLTSISSMQLTIVGKVLDKSVLGLCTLLCCN